MRLHLYWEEKWRDLVHAACAELLAATGAGDPARVRIRSLLSKLRMPDCPVGGWELTPGRARWAI